MVPRRQSKKTLRGATPPRPASLERRKAPLGGAPPLKTGGDGPLVR